MADMLAEIVARKRGEVERRLRHRGLVSGASGADLRAGAAGLSGGEVLNDRGAAAVRRLRRGADEALQVIAEVKRRSPSAGLIRPWARGDVARIACTYERAGAAAISVLCDRPGFGGSPLDLRRAAAVVEVPLLFKEFVVHRHQVQLARAMGAAMVLLLVRVLSQPELVALVRACTEAGLAPVVEAADAQELTRALDTEATIVGVNARDLRSFSVDLGEAAELVERIPRERVAVFMSGISTPQRFAQVAAGRADAVLIGEALMRGDDPGARLAELRAAL